MIDRDTVGGPLEWRRIIVVRIDATSYDDATRRILAWAWSPRGRYVCVATVHSVMEAYDNAEFRDVMNGADLVTPDGMPLVWGLRLLGVPGASRVYGPELTLRLCDAASREGIAVGFYGGTPQVLEAFTRALRHRFPGLRIAYAVSPPFRPLEAEEEARVMREVAASGAQILFVGLGCPKQERWMARNVRRADVSMVGVGAAFDFIAGAKPQAPRWIRDIGMEWAFRLAIEPRRLWRRYLYHNPRFVALFARQLLAARANGLAKH